MMIVLVLFITLCNFYHTRLFTYSNVVLQNNFGNKGINYNIHKVAMHCIATKLLRICPLMCESIVSMGGVMHFSKFTISKSIYSLLTQHNSFVVSSGKVSVWKLHVQSKGRQSTESTHSSEPEKAYPTSELGVKRWVSSLASVVQHVSRQTKSQKFR